jgi:HEAT repeat protein
MPFLLSAVKKNPPELSADLYVLLRDLGPAAKETVPALIEAMKEPGTHDEAVGVLSAIGAAAVPELKKALASKVFLLRAGAASALTEIGPAAAPALPDVVKLLSDPDDELRFRGVDAVASIGPAARTAIPDLIKLTKDADPNIRLGACTALGHIGAATPEAVQALTSSLNDPQEYVREQAAGALGWLGPEAKAALPALAKVKTARGMTRLATAYAVARIDPAHADGLSVLLASVKDDNWKTKVVAIRDLQELGAFAKAARPALLEQLDSPILEVRVEAARALGVAGIEAKTANRLAGLLKGPSLRLARTSAFALAQANGPELKESLKTMLESLDDPDPELSTWVALAILKADGKQAKARERLKERLDVLTKGLEQSRKKPQHPGQRLAATYWLSALEQLGPDAKEARAPIERLAKDDPETDIRNQAARVLKAVDGK